MTPAEELRLAESDLGREGAVARIGNHVFLTQNHQAANLAASGMAVSEPRHGVRVVRGGASERVLVAMDKHVPGAPPPQSVASE